MNIKIVSNQSNFTLSSTNEHLLDIYNLDYYLELGVIDIQKLGRLLNGKELNLTDLIYNDLAVDGTGKITDDASKDIFFQVNYLTSLRQKSSSDHFFITCSVICYEDSFGVEKHAPLILIPVDLDYENYKVIISGQPIVNNLLINTLNNELENGSTINPYQTRSLFFQRKFTTVESIDYFTKETAQKYHKKFSIDNFLTIGKIRLTAGQNNSEIFDVLHSVYEKEAAPNVLIKKYYHEVNAVLPTNMEQKYALLNAANGKSFIVNGKLGSGKSYTAINMIVDALSKNKKILYVNQDIDNLFEIKKNLAVLKLDVYTYNFAKNIKTIKMPPLSFPDYEKPNFDYNPFYAADYGPIINYSKNIFKRKTVIDSHEDDIDKLEKFGRDFSIKGKKITMPDGKVVYKRYYGVSKRDIYEQLAILKRENPNIKLIRIEKDLEYHEVIENAKGLIEVEKRLMKKIKPSYEINCWLNLSVIHNNFSDEEIGKRTTDLYMVNKEITKSVKQYASKYKMNMPHNMADLYNLISDIGLFKKTRPQKNWHEQKKRNSLIIAWQDIKDSQDLYDESLGAYKKLIRSDEIINIEEILKQIYADIFIESKDNQTKNEVFIDRLLTETDKTTKIAEEIDKLTRKIMSEYKEICSAMGVDSFNEEMLNALYKLADYLKENHLQKKIYTQYTENSNFLREMYNKTSKIKYDIDNAKKNFRQFLEKGIKDDFAQASSVFNSGNEQRELKKIFNNIRIRQANLKPDEVKQNYRNFYERQRELNSLLVDNTKVGKYSTEEQYKAFADFVNLVERSNKKEEKFIRNFYDKFIDDEHKLKQISNLIVTFVKDISKIESIESKLVYYNINVTGNTSIDKTNDLIKWENYLLNVVDIKRSLSELFVDKKKINYHNLLLIKKNVLKIEEINDDFKKNNKRYKELLGESYQGIETDVSSLRQLIEHFLEFYNRFNNSEDVNQIFDDEAFTLMYNDAMQLNSLYNTWTTKFRAFSTCFMGGQPNLQIQSFEENMKHIEEYYKTTDQIGDVLFVSDWINRLKKYGLTNLANGIKKGEYKVNLSNSYLYSSLLNYRDIVEEYEDKTYTTDEFLAKLKEYNRFEKDYCTKNILKLQSDAKKEKEIQERIINRKIKNIDFNNYNQYLKAINRPRFVCLSDLSAFDSEIDLSYFDLVIIDDAHLVDSTLTRKLDKIKQVVVFGDRSFKTSATSNFMIFINNTLIQKNRSAVINFRLRYLQMASDFSNEFTYRNQYILSRRRDKTTIDGITKVDDFSEKIFQTFMNNQEYLINVVIANNSTRRKVYTYLVKRLMSFYSEEEIHIILNYRIRIINAVYETGSYAEVAYIYYPDIDKREDKNLILRNFSTVQEEIHIACRIKNDDLENEKNKKEIAQLIGNKKEAKISSPIANILIKDLRQKKNDKTQIMQGCGCYDIIIKLMTNTVNANMLGIIIKGKQNELIYSNINTYNYYVTTFENFGWNVMVIDIESLVDDYEGVIRKINEKCEQLRRQK